VSLTVSPETIEAGRTRRHGGITGEPAALNREGSS
jgi:hypothetical protein